MITVSFSLSIYWLVDRDEALHYTLKLQKCRTHGPIFRYLNIKLEKLGIRKKSSNSKKVDHSDHQKKKKLQKKVSRF